MCNQDLVIFDLDGTLISGQSQKMFLKYLKKERYIGISYFVHIYFWFILYKLSLVSDPKKIFQYAITFLKDKSINEVAQIVSSFIEDELRFSFYRQAISIFNNHKEKGDHVIILSTAINPLVKSVAQYLNANNFLSTELTIKDAKYTGTIQGDIAYGNSKVKKIQRYLYKSKLSYNEIFVYTDHHSDQPLLSFATKPYAVNPTRQLRKISKKLGWKIIKLS